MPAGSGPAFSAVVCSPLLLAVPTMRAPFVLPVRRRSEGLSPEGVEGWESMLYHVKALAPVCDDLAGERCHALWAATLQIMPCAACAFLPHTA